MSGSWYAEENNTGDLYQFLKFIEFSRTNSEHRPLTLKVNKDDEVIILEVIAPPEVKVFDEVPPPP